MQRFDVIVVGGRVAGSTLAIGLAKQNLRVLLVEKEQFPKKHVFSSPVIYASTMRLLDNLGVAEEEYAHNTPRLYSWVYDVRDAFSIEKAIPLRFGRNYAYAVDRARFDFALWRKAAQMESVIALQPFTVTSYIQENGRVVGVRGRSPDQPEQVFTADWIVGADGRYSLLARTVHATPYHVRSDIPTSYYYAYWKGVEPYKVVPSVHLFASGLGYGHLIMESADDTTCVVVGGRSDRFASTHGIRERYFELLRCHPQIWRRFRQAYPVTPMYGIRNVGNMYRNAGGPGWALVGDALHQKDPIDGQGIYDAVFTAISLSTSIAKWKAGAGREDAVKEYQRAIERETIPMYKVTTRRVQTELFVDRPSWAYTTWIRWLFTDRAYQERLSLLLVRGIAPEAWRPWYIIAHAFIKGATSDIVRFFTRRSHAQRVKAPHAFPDGPGGETEGEIAPIPAAGTDDPELSS